MLRAVRAVCGTRIPDTLLRKVSLLECDAMLPGIPLRLCTCWVFLLLSSCRDSGAPNSSEPAGELDRRAAYRELIAAELAARDEAERRLPTEPDQVLAVGDELVLRYKVVLMSATNAEEWDGGSMDLPAKTNVRVLAERFEPSDGSNDRWLELAAWLPGSTTGHRGWARAWFVGQSHPVCCEEDASLARLHEQDRIAAQLRAEAVRRIANKYGITTDELDAIRKQGMANHWPYEDPQFP